MTATPRPSPAGTRERLLDSAERLFAARGFASTSVRDITEAADANLGAVNYHFGSKAHLYTEVFVRRAALLRDPVVAAAREAAAVGRRDPHRAFRTLGRAFLASHEDRAAAASLMGLFAREVLEPSLPTRLFVREFYEPTIDAITRVVREVRPDLSEASARDCAHAFFAQLMHVVKGTGVAVTPVDQRLERAVRFTVAGVSYLENEAGDPSHSKASRKTSRWST